MANIKGLVSSRSLPTASADGLYKEGHSNRIGDIGTFDFIQGLLFAGKCYGVDVGAFSTPIQGGGAGTIIDIDQPEAIISIPSGMHILPYRIQVCAFTPLLATDADESEVLIAVDRANAWAVDGTYTTETPFNLFTKLGTAGTSCLAASAFTADTTDPVLGIELARSIEAGDVQGTPATAVWTKHELLYEPKIVPIISGPAMIVIYWGGTVATTGFAQIRWAELPDSYFV